MQLLYYYMCGECGKSPLAYDKSKGEIFCISCGLIIAENYSVFSIIDYINDIERIDKRLDTRLNIIPKY